MNKEQIEKMFDEIYFTFHKKSNGNIIISSKIKYKIFNTIIPEVLFGVTFGSSASFEYVKERAKELYCIDL